MSVQGIKDVVVGAVVQLPYNGLFAMFCGKVLAISLMTTGKGVINYCFDADNTRKTIMEWG